MRKPILAAALIALLLGGCEKNVKDVRIDHAKPSLASSR